jgi:phage-related protein
VADVRLALFQDANPVCRCFGITRSIGSLAADSQGSGIQGHAGVFAIKRTLYVRTALTIYAKFRILLCMKDITWQGSSFDDLCGFPVSARRAAGYQLDKLQRGLEPNDWKPMPTIGAGVREIRITDEAGAFRVIYVANIGRTIHVLHAFQKKSQRTSQTDIKLALARFKMIKR